MLEIICGILLIGFVTLGFLYRREKSEVEFWRGYYLDKLNDYDVRDNSDIIKDYEKRCELRRKRLEKFNYRNRPDQNPLK